MSRPKREDFHWRAEATPMRSETHGQRLLGVPAVASGNDRGLRFARQLRWRGCEGGSEADRSTDPDVTLGLPDR